MKRWLQVVFSIGVLAQAAHAAEVELRIAPPEPEWLLPPMVPPPCGLVGGGRLESCPTQLYPEGLPLVTEESLVLEISPLIAAARYEAVLARVRMNYGVELELLEAGDAEGFLRTRIPRAGGGGGGGGQAPSGGSAPPAGLYSDRSRPSNTGPAIVGMRSLLDFISASVLYTVGHSYFSLQQDLPAETAFKLVLTALPNHVRAHESLGMLYLRAERYEAARVHLARALELGRNTAHVHAALGYLEQKTRHYSAAANAFQRALVLEPDSRSALRGLLHALTETREHAKARVLVGQLLQDEPDDSDLWVYRAQITLAAGDRAAALASLETALRLGDDSVTNRETCAALHLESGNIARAVDLLRGSRAPGLEFSLVDQALGWLANENEWDQFRALAASLDRSALGPVRQSRLLTRRASLALHDRDRRAASAALQEALALDPSNADALLALGQIYRGDRDYGRAELLFQRASVYGPARETALVARAEVAIDQENFDGAIAHLRDVVTSNPARADVRRNIDLLENLRLLRTQR